MAQLLLEKITKTYPGGILALDEFTLAIQDGEFVVLLGPSASGKSTLLRVVAGLEEIEHGKVIMGDREVTHCPPRERDVAMVFQNHALYPHRTVYENIAFPLRLRKLSSQEISARTRETAAILGVEELLQRKPEALSGGERQRVALGKAIVRRPKVFLLDEPLSSLDARLRLQMREEIKSLHRRLKMTVLHVTHDQEEALALGDRLVVLNHGSIQQVGSPAGVYHHPLNRFVAGFLGSPSINLLAGHVTAEPDGAYFDLGYSKLRLPRRLGERLAGRLQGRRSEELILGIRPERISIRAGASSSGSSSQSCLKAAVASIETLGDKTVIYLRAPRGERIAIKLDSDARVVDGQIAEGQSIDICLDLDQAHIFAGNEDGTNLTLP